MVLIPFVSLVFLICSYVPLPLVASVNAEGLALLSFKHASRNFPEENNWKSSDKNPCSWIGITCREGKVFSLSFPSMKLSGFLPADLGNLSGVRRVNLRNNNFSGNLPVELFNATNLQSLVLSGNSFSGPVPSQIGKLRYLQVLDLSHNSFSSRIPSSIVQCKRLKTVVLNQNSFTGPLPDGFGTNLTSLQKLDLSFNSFSGLIPNSMANLSRLKGVLSLSHNLFNGSIPESLGSRAETVYIDLSYNNLSGSIPQIASLLSLGPTAFIGNALLCGPPLKVSCQSGPSDRTYSKPLPIDADRHSHHSYAVISTVAVAMLLGICITGFFIYHRYNKASVSKWDENVGAGRLEAKLKIKRELFCCTRNEVDTASENMEQYEFVPLDSKVDFDLDQLLKASAFLLGKSTIGIVYKVVLNNGGAVAVRRLGNGGRQRFKEFQIEVETIGKITHPNVVSLRAYFWSVDEKLLIYNYIPNGNLSAAIHGKAGIISHRPLPWSVRLKIIKGVAKGVAFLHEISPRRYVHGDLRPSNILLGKNMEPYISDFGLGRLADIAEEQLEDQWEQIVGTSQQSSPYELTEINYTANRSHYQGHEAPKVRKLTQKWDVYSYGLILLEVITAKLPMIQIGSQKMSIVQWIQIILEERKPVNNILDPFLARDLDKEDEMVSVLKLALDCIHKSPHKRPSMRHICDSLDRIGWTLPLNNGL